MKKTIVTLTAIIPAFLLNAVAQTVPAETGAVKLTQPPGVVTATAPQKTGEVKLKRPSFKNTSSTNILLVLNDVDQAAIIDYVENTLGKQVEIIVEKADVEKKLKP